MRIKVRALAGAAALALGASAVIAQTAAPLPAQYRAYLPDGSLTLDPQPGDRPSAAHDRAVFRQTRALEGTPRWTLAQADAGPAC